MKKFLPFLALAGVVDAAYLVYEHYAMIIPPCPANPGILIDCGAVLSSKFSMVFGVPMALLGLVHYVLLLTWLVLYRKKFGQIMALLEVAGGAIFSLYLIFLQIAIIHAICIYCMASALISLIIFALLYREFIRIIGSLFYQIILKPILFLIDPEFVHVAMTRFGEIFWWFPWGLRKIQPELSQKILNINFELPIGLAAGFDYEGRLTKSLAPLGFGFQTIGTITHLPHEGNSQPRLGRLPKSKSLMVNKGFRNPGTKSIITKIQDTNFKIPVGISIGDPRGDIKEIIAAFKNFEHVNNSYFELNISCPNLPHAKELDLEKLLSQVDKLKLNKPVFVKMPINKTDSEFIELCKVISKHQIVGLIIGNLQKDRKFVDKTEVSKFPVGNFSGKPTFEQSNHLIKLAYKNFKKRFVIIGCGGVFSAGDAYTKIKLGASLVQLITGMIYQGPFLIAQINLGLKELLEKDGYKNISEAVGIDAV